MSYVERCLQKTEENAVYCEENTKYHYYTSIN